MNEWEAKYKAVLMVIDNQEYIDNAEMLVLKAQRIAASGILTFECAVYAMMDLVRQQQGRDIISQMEKVK